jgi:Spy/CpxP family protein refolding chaperone
MNRIFLTIAFVLSLAFGVSFAMAAHADEQPAEQKDGPSAFHHGGPCGKFKLDDDQKSKMKAAWFKFREEKIDMKANIEKARLKYAKLMSDPNTDYSSAKSASKEISEDVSKMIAAKEMFKTKVAFEILKPEQRQPAMDCLPYLRGKGHHHHRHHHEDWN